MNKEQLIELGLTGEQVTAVVDGFGKMIPKSRFDEKVAEVNDYKQQIAERDTQLTELQSKAQGNEELQAQITALQEQNAQVASEYEQKLAQKDYDIALTEALRTAKAKNPTAVKALLQTDAIKLDGDKLLGLDEQLAKLKETDDYLFVADGLRGATPPQGQTPSPKVITRAEFAKMTYADRMALVSQNPNIMSELK